MHVIAGIYRVIMAALYFAFFGIGALIISLVLFNVLKLFVHDEHSLRNKSRNITSPSFKFVILVEIVFTSAAVSQFASSHHWYAKSFSLALFLYT